MSDDDKLFMRTFFMRVALVVSLIALGFNACSPINEWFGVPDDNPVEELVEQYIEAETGFRIDLSPATIE